MTVGQFKADEAIKKSDIILMSPTSHFCSRLDDAQIEEPCNNDEYFNGTEGDIPNRLVMPLKYVQAQGRKGSYIHLLKETSHPQSIGLIINVRVDVVHE